MNRDKTPPGGTRQFRRSGARGAWPVVCVLWLAMAMPLSAQRGVPGRVPTGPHGTYPVPVPTGPGPLTGTLPQTQTTLPQGGQTTVSGVEWTNEGSVGVQAGSDIVVDRAAEEEARAFESLERRAARTDLLGRTPVLEKMRRLRR